MLEVVEGWVRKEFKTVCKIGFEEILSIRY